MKVPQAPLVLTDRPVRLETQARKDHRVYPGPRATLAQQDPVESRVRPEVTVLKETLVTREPLVRLEARAHLENRVCLEILAQLDLLEPQETWDQLALPVHLACPVRTENQVKARVFTK